MGLKVTQQGTAQILLILYFIWNSFSVPLWHTLAALSSSPLLLISVLSEEKSLHDDIHGCGEGGRVSCRQALGTVLSLAKHFWPGRQETSWKQCWQFMKLCLHFPLICVSSLSILRAALSRDCFFQCMYAAPFGSQRIAKQQKALQLQQEEKKLG